MNICALPLALLSRDPVHMLGLMLAPLGAVECPGGLTHIDAPLRSTAPAGPLVRICRY